MENKKQKEGLGVSGIVAIVSSVFGALCFLLLLAQGISGYTVGYYPSYFNLALMIFGTEWVGVNPGLLCAFIFDIVALIASVVCIFKPNAGFISILFYLTAGILWFCAVPLYGVDNVGLGAGSICLGTFNFLNMILMLIASTYR